MSLLILGMLAGFLGCEGCGSGTNFRAMPLDRDQVINYGQQVLDGKIPPEAVIYGQLVVGDSSGPGSTSFEAEQKELAQNVQKLKALPGADEADFAAFVDDLSKKIQAISPDIDRATQNAGGAKSLAVVLEPQVRTNGGLEALFNNNEKNVKPEAKKSYDAIKKDVTDSFNRLYKAAIATAQGFMQKEAKAEVARIRLAFNGLKENAKEKPIFTNVVDIGPANNALTEAITKLDSVETYIFLFASKDQVGVPFTSSVSALSTAITTTLKNNYLNKTDAAAKAETTILYEDAEKGVQALTKLGADYTIGGIEQLKTGTGDAALDMLRETALGSGSSGVLGQLNLEDPTNTNDLMSMLANKPVVGMPNDALSQYMVYSLAAGVVSNVQEQFGLKAGNVLGLDATLLIKAKKDYGMDNVQFKNYVTSRAELLNKESQEAGRSDVYVLFADLLESEGADIRAMIEAFVTSNGKVLAVATDLNPVREKGSLFFAKELNIGEVIITAKAALEGEPDISPGTAASIADKIGRMSVGLGHPIKLSDVGGLAKNASSNLRGRTPTDKAIQQAVKGALHAKNIPTIAADNSRVIDEDLKVLQAKLKDDPQYYHKVGLGQDPTLRLREIQEMTKARKQGKELEERWNKRDALESRIKKLEGGYKHYEAELLEVIKNLGLPSENAEQFDTDIRKAHLDARGTLDSMSNMLNNAVCDIDPWSRESYDPNDYDGGYRNFISRPASPARQAYDVHSVVFPLQLLEVTSDRIKVAQTARRDFAKRAALTLNCFLTAPEQTNKFGGQYQLFRTVTQLIKLVENVSYEAIRLARQTLYPKMIEKVSALNNLKDRVQGESDTSSWRHLISPFNATHNSGAIFEIIEKLPPYLDASRHGPRNSKANISIFPEQPKWAATAGYNLPNFFLARPDADGTGRPEYKVGDSNFDLRANTLAADEWSIANVYGNLVGAAIYQGTHNLGVKPWAPSKDDFDALHRRLWALYLSRIAGPIKNGVPLSEDLYKGGGHEKWFALDNTFIGILYDKTEEFIQAANRNIIADMGFAVIKEYKGMLDLLYNFSPEDVDDFLNQHPPTELSDFFNKLPSIMIEAEGVNEIVAGDQAAIGNWLNKIIPNEVYKMLPYGTNAFEITGADPIDVGNNKLLKPIWGSLVNASAQIKKLGEQINERIADIK